MGGIGSGKGEETVPFIGVAIREWWLEPLMSSLGCLWIDEYCRQEL